MNSAKSLIKVKPQSIELFEAVLLVKRSGFVEVYDMFVTSKFSFLTLLFVLIGTFCMAEDSSAWRDLKESSVRNGLPNVAAKLAAGEPVKIAYLGGSITSQQGWRIYSEAWFEERYPDSEITGINAAIGGTGSTLGVFRLERDVLQHEPDLLFVEFAVNDRAGLEYQLAMEGIVRKTWKRFPDTDICFVYTITNHEIEHLRTGKMKRTSSNMEAIADYYGIPTVHMGVEIVEMEKAGRLVMKEPEANMEAVSGDDLNQSSELPASAGRPVVFSKDGVHPYVDTGHRLYMDALARSLPQALAVGEAFPHRLSDPMFENNWEQATIVKISELGPDSLEGAWQQLKAPEDPLAKRFLMRMPELWRAEPGSTLSFQFKGTRVAVYDLLGPGCGMIRVTVDGKSRMLKRMDGYCHYYRLGTVELAGNLEDTVHDVVVEVSTETFDKRSVLFERVRNKFDESPERFEAMDWYPGAVFLLGELVH
ncbi:SGNH/GDSL hydrolase family protein [Puniceicoccus vermicola]|uniref:SGNH/GDSL hydrolase family protein n=1 Tax=Puniceicoccus vermicola TaxID=388746 RepID=A0A7X1AZ62_9BACT|nr:SGNH/GDSL hydrolase family protein [Puniceicoccus vermicola]MBC2602656.1 SGNH/GDSL hydrolase family protein [Puniceicoccus vermicola]